MTSPALTPLRSGLTGGLIELRQAFSGAALAGQLLWPTATLIALFFFRHRELAGSGFTIGALMLPGTLGMFVAFGMMLMVQYLPADREDGTLQRARATPGGISGYLAGKLLTSSLSVLVYLVIIGIPGRSSPAACTWPTSPGPGSPGFSCSAWPAPSSSARLSAPWSPARAAPATCRCRCSA